MQKRQSHDELMRLFPRNATMRRAIAMDPTNVRLTQAELNRVYQALHPALKHRERDLIQKQRRPRVHETRFGELNAGLPHNLKMYRV